MHKNRKKKLIIIIASTVITITAILYSLADRYLIEHVQIDNTNLISNVYAADGNSDNSAGSNDDNSSSANSSESSNSLDSSNSSSVAAASGSSYVNGDTSVTVKKVTTGSGSDTVTYYVADVKLASADVLKSAFAKNKFGTNIIETTSSMAENNNAIFAINGDYYGFRTDGIIIRNGVIYRDEPARTGLAFYKDGSMKIYDETTTTAEKLLADGVINTLSFGPALLENSEIPDGISNVEVDTNFGNHSIQGNQPRTGIGIIDNNHFVFIVVDGRSEGYSKGVTITEFAQIFKDLGCTEAYNIDGGGSSTMYFNGQLVNNPLGKNRERGTSDILYIANGD